jgi:serine/threonine protein kinase/tetratricopeptide (TPR) repeat protein
MTVNHTERVRELFLAARALDGEERHAYLERAAASDAGVVEEVRELLATEEDADFLETPALGRDFREHAVASIVTTHEEQQLERIGPFRILRLIGEGGFARVYAAQQEEPVQRRVAIKLLKPGVATGEVIRRFEAEGQHLASMDHPSVARMYDAGTTDDGRPYFIMEYVEGETIIAFCRQARSSLPERLDLFLQVCDAVHYAHQRGIIHRDLKPTNILIDAAGPHPTPKVIDFGVAKTIREGARDEATHTPAGQLVGTPEYMSPEQANGQSVDVDTRTDLYGLGVILYELLTGTRPFDFSAPQRVSWLELARIICERPPVRPSLRISSGNGASTRAAARHAGPPDDAAQKNDTPTSRKEPPDHRLPPTPARAVRGDLDWIVMRCLQKNPTDRYESVAALATDIRRYLNCEPVSAGPPSTLYRLRKFVSKHRTPVVASVALLALTAATVTAMIFGAIAEANLRTAEAQGQALRAEAELADERSRLAEERSRAFVQMLDSFLSVPLERGHSVTVLDMIKDSDRMFAAGDTTADAAAPIRLRYGILWSAFGDYDAAWVHLTKARRLYLEVGDLVGAARAALMLAKNNYDLDLLFEQDNLEDTRTLVEQGLQHVPAADAESWPVRVELLLLRARLVGSENPAEAEDNLSEADQLLKQYAATESHLHGYWLAAEARRRYARGERAAVLPELRQALAILQRTLGPAHRDTLDLAIEYADVASKLRQSELAEETFSKAIADVKKYLGPEHPRVATAYTHRAEMYFSLARRDAAESDVGEALSICAGHLATDNPAWLHATQYAVKIAVRHGRFLSEAEELAREVVTRVESRYGSDSRTLIMPLTNLNAARFARRQFTPETVASMSREIALRKKYKSTRDVGAVARARDLAECLVARGQCEEALAVLEEPLQIVREDHDPHSDRLVSFEQVYLSGLRGLGDGPREEAFLLAIYEREHSQPLAPPEYVASVCQHLAALYERWDKPELAEQWASEAAVRYAALGQKTPQPKQP